LIFIALLRHQTYEQTYYVTEKKVPSPDSAESQHQA